MQAEIESESVNYSRMVTELQKVLFKKFRVGLKINTRSTPDHQKEEIGNL